MTGAYSNPVKSAEGHPIHKWHGNRIVDLAITSDGQNMIAICLDNLTLGSKQTSYIRVYDMDKKEEKL